MRADCYMCNSIIKTSRSHLHYTLFRQGFMLKEEDPTQLTSVSHPQATTLTQPPSHHPPLHYPHLTSPSPLPSLQTPSSPVVPAKITHAKKPPIGKNPNHVFANPKLNASSQSPIKAGHHPSYRPDKNHPYSQGPHPHSKHGRPSGQKNEG